MPAYDYHCETNGRTVEVSHTMTTLLQTWGGLGGVPCVLSSPSVTTW